MEDFKKKAKNFYILGKIAEKLNMLSEAASNYFKSLSALNDCQLETKNLKANDHTDRFNLLKNNFPKLYEITDKLFTVYRRTYTEELDNQEILRLRESIEEAFKNVGIDIPTDKDIEEQTKKFFKK